MIPHNKPDIIIYDNKEETCMLIDVTISGNINVTKNEVEKILKYKDLNNINTAHVECKNKCDTSNNRGNWNHLKIIQKIAGQHNGKARNQGTTENSHTGHYFGKY
jgi:hypothetical protein